MLTSSIGLLKKSYALYREHFWLLIGYAAWLLFPRAGYFLTSFFQKESGATIILQVIFSIIEMVLSIWIGIILVHLATRLEQKKNPETADLTPIATRQVGQVVWVAILSSVFILLGFVALIIPGIILMVWYAFVEIAAILDEKKGMQALRFSHDLVRGKFFPVLGRMLVGPLIVMVIYAIILGVLLSLLGLIVGFNPVTILTTTKLPPWIELITSSADIFVLPLLAIYMTKLYLELKAEKLASTNTL
jgi:hypothetical protein